MSRSALWLSLGLMLLAAAGCAPAHGPAAEPLPRLDGRTLLAGCRQGECRWLRIIEVETPARVAQGELRRMRVRDGASRHPDGNLPGDETEARIEWEAGEGRDFAFCSTLRPAYGFEREGGGVTVHFLDLFALAGYQTASAGLYMRLCHGRDRLPGADALRRLGYRAGTRSEQVENATPETMTRF